MNKFKVYEQLVAMHGQTPNEAVQIVENLDVPLAEQTLPWEEDEEIELNEDDFEVISGPYNH